MKKFGKIILWVLSVCTVAAIAAILLTQYVFTTETDNEDEMLGTMQEWGRLAPLPDSASDLQISAEGSMFTRGFHARFYLPDADLAAWIEASPGLQDAQVQAQDHSSREYIIEPGGGAQYAEAVIDFGSGLVRIYTYWS